MQITLNTCVAKTYTQLDMCIPPIVSAHRWVCGSKSFILWRFISLCFMSALRMSRRLVTWRPLPLHIVEPSALEHFGPCIAHDLACSIWLLLPSQIGVWCYIACKVPRWRWCCVASECQGWNVGDVCGKHQVCSRWSSVQPSCYNCTTWWTRI